VDQELVASLLDRVMTWVEDDVPVETIAVWIRRHLPNPPDRIRLVKELRRWAHRLSTDDREPGPAARADRRGDGAGRQVCSTCGDPSWGRC
jgi:hypothetical protein